MLGFVVQIVDHIQDVQKAADKANFRNLGHAAARIRKDAVASIQTAEGPSKAGTPPHTRRRQLNRAITFDANKESAVIGPRASVVGEAGAAHEFGETFRGFDYDERPFMGPALEKNLDKFQAEWQGSIGGE